MKRRIRIPNPEIKGRADGSEGEEKGRVRRATPRVGMEKQRRTRLRSVYWIWFGCETKVKKSVSVRMIVNDIL